MSNLESTKSMESNAVLAKEQGAGSLKVLSLSLVAGVLFSLGLVASGMTQPAKVIAFLDLGGLAKGISWQAQPGLWDPSLALVMGGALMVTLLAFAITPKWSKPWAGARFDLPTKNDLDIKLLGGAALFGIGWGLAGYCPGPALASILSGGMDAMGFVGAMIVGMWVAKRWLA
jgi:uncharacterized protein